MGFRQIRTGTITHIGPLRKDRYETRGGVETYLGAEYVVQVVVRIEDGPDKGREVRIEMGTLEALTKSRKLDDVRHEVHAKQTALDAPETGEDDGSPAVSGHSGPGRAPGADGSGTGPETGVQRF